MVRGAGAPRTVVRAAIPDGATRLRPEHLDAQSPFWRRGLLDRRGRSGRERRAIFGHRRPPWCVARRAKCADQRFFSLARTSAASVARETRTARSPSGSARPARFRSACSKTGRSAASSGRRMTARRIPTRRKPRAQVARFAARSVGSACRLPRSRNRTIWSSSTPAARAAPERTRGEPVVACRPRSTSSEKAVSAHTRSGDGDCSVISPEGSTTSGGNAAPASSSAGSASARPARRRSGSGGSRVPGQRGRRSPRERTRQTVRPARARSRRSVPRRAPRLRRRPHPPRRPGAPSPP